MTGEPMDESEVVAGVVTFANGAELPDFLRRLPGDFESMPGVTVVNRLTGEPVAQGVAARREQLRADLAAIAAGKLTRARLNELETQSLLVVAETRGLRRRPVFLRPPDLQAALGYVAYLIAKRTYGKRLTRCERPECQQFFLRVPRRGSPDAYCSTACRDEAEKVAARLRSQKARNEKAAIKALSATHARAKELVKAVSEPGLSVEELVQHARARSAAKHK